MFYHCLALFTTVYAVICDLLTLYVFSHGIRNVRLYEYYIYLPVIILFVVLICALKPCDITTFSYSKTLVEFHKFECDVGAIKKRTLKEFFRQILEVA